MAKTLVKKKICDACGAEVRPGSLFCYNCGGAVAAELPETGKLNNRKAASDTRFQSDLKENTDFTTSNIDLKTTPLKEETVNRIEARPIAKPTEELLEKIEVKPLEKPSLQEEAKLKSAASLRRKAKSFQRKRVEVVWEEPENAPNKWFPIFAILLVLFVVGIFYLAMYLK